MTCAHVLGLIDAEPFAAYPQEHLDAARAHARECPTCGPALEAASLMTAELRALPGPDAPEDLATAGSWFRHRSSDRACPGSRARTRLEPGPYGARGSRGRPRIDTDHAQ